MTLHFHLLHTTINHYNHTQNTFFNLHVLTTTTSHNLCFTLTYKLPATSNFHSSTSLIHHYLNIKQKKKKRKSCIAYSPSLITTFDILTSFLQLKKTSYHTLTNIFITIKTFFSPSQNRPKNHNKHLSIILPNLPFYLHLQP